MKAAIDARRLSRVLTAVAVALVAADGGIYLWLMYVEDDDRPAWWFVAGLLVVIILGLASLWRAGAGSVAVGIVGGMILLALGILGIFSVGMPLVVAGILMLTAAAVRRRANCASVPTAQ